MGRTDDADTERSVSGGRGAGAGLAGAPLWVVVPVKLLAQCKQRLRTCLGPARLELARAMLQDVLAALSAAATVSGVLVVTRDPEVAKLARAGGAKIEPEPARPGMNAAIRQGMAAAKKMGARTVVIVPGDVPLLTADEFGRLVHVLQRRTRGDTSDMLGIVPAADYRGTNWLSLSMARPFTPLYGPDSYRRHLAHARKRGFRPITLVSQPLGLDLDTPADIRAFLDFCERNPAFRGTNTWKFLTSRATDLLMPRRNHLGLEKVPNERCHST